jgi:ferredoxin
VRGSVPSSASAIDATTQPVKGHAVRLTIDRERCEGYGLCAESAPELMHLDDEGELVLDYEDVPPQSGSAAESAVRVCPVAALKAI